MIGIVSGFPIPLGWWCGMSAGRLFVLPVLCCNMELGHDLERFSLWWVWWWFEGWWVLCVLEYVSGGVGFAWCGPAVGGIACSGLRRRFCWGRLCGCR